MMYRALKYVNHLLTATNHHGVHSPFVYTYLTKCIYVKSNYKASKCEELMLKSIPYLNINSIKLSSSDDSLEKRIADHLKKTLNTNAPYDLLYFENPLMAMKLDFEEVHNETLVIINQIHHSRALNGAWQSLADRTECTVTIDAFHCGLIFFRKEQEPQHFKIRI